MSERERLRGLASRGPGHDISLETLWLARALWERWPPRRTPRPLLLLRRPDTSEDRWNGVRDKLDARARPELEAAGVHIRIQWTPDHAHVDVVTAASEGGVQLDIFEVLELAAHEEAST